MLLEDAMKKDVTMRKTNFVKGAFITTFGIIISKLLGVLYVIPFHAMIGEKGGALYGYAYTIYAVFMSIATAGIPLAISKLVSEFQTLGYYQAKKRVFYLGKKVSLLLGFVCFMIVMVFAPLLAKVVLGDVSGGNTIEDVTLVIRVIGTSILIVPLLSVYRGYFEGHRFMSPPSISQVIEQLIRVFIIIFGSYCTVKIFHLSLAEAVSVALLGATIGAFFSFLYLFYKKKKNPLKFNEKIRPVNEPKITDKTIIKKICVYAFPFILIDIFKSFYNFVDMATVVKGLVHYASFEAYDAEYIYSILSTWGAKFNMIILSISTGIVVSLIPSLTESLVKNEKDEVQKKIHQAFSMLLYFTIPLTMGISFLAKAVWSLFYGNSLYGPNVLCYFIFVGFFIGLFTSMVTILQTLKDYKVVFISLFIGVFCKVLLNINFMKAFYQMGLPPYYGFITASILGYFVSSIICIVALKKKYHIQFENMVQDLINIMVASFLMIFCLFIIKLLVPVYSSSRIVNLFIILFYGIVGIVIYFFYGNITGLTKNILGKQFFKNIRINFFSK